jgi:SAM-dependent methyltransferase
MNNVGIAEELTFWKEFVHSEQFATWLVKGKPAPELDPVIVDLIQQESGPVLDVGSGVVSILYGVTDDLTSTDLLADAYQSIFDYQDHGITPPIPCAAEDLNLFECFQVVHMRNALDHTKAPVEAWENLKRAVRPGGLLIVAGFENEGSHLHGLGMHQWDLSLQGNTLVCTDRAGLGHFLLHPEFSVLVSSISELPNGRCWVTWVGRKP